MNISKSIEESIRLVDINSMIQYIGKYGYIFLAIIVFLEYLNLPGMPAGIIMPAAGILVKSDGLNFIYTLIISVIAALVWNTNFK